MCPADATAQGQEGAVGLETSALNTRAGVAVAGPIHKVACIQDLMHQALHIATAVGASGLPMTLGLMQ